MKFDQDLCLNLQYDFGKMNSTLGSVVPLAMFFRNTGLLLSIYGTLLTLLTKLTKSAMMMLLAKTAMEHKEDDFAVLLTNNWPP